MYFPKKKKRTTGSEPVSLFLAILGSTVPNGHKIFLAMVRLKYGTWCKFLYRFKASKRKNVMRLVVG